GTLLVTSGYSTSQQLQLSNTSGIAVASGQTHTRTGSITGGGALTKVGGGTLEIGVAAGHTGGTNVNEGTLSLITGGSLPATGLTLNSAGTIRFANGVVNTFSTLPTNVAGSGISIAPSSTVTITASGGTLSSNLSDSGPINYNPSSATLLAFAGNSS